MPNIRILPDRVANQIAAGEVIERPVAVVKELVENSVDAGADRVEIEFRKGGKSYIRVEDNGRGMSADEALTALERHATSKVASTEDLTRVASFGFRGEALPSIASVSRFTLRTRREEDAEGTEIRVNGGRLVDRKACGMPPGTEIEVSQLFNAVPARRKFLKTDATETAHITYACRLFAVAHPGVAIRLIDGGRALFRSPACDSLADRVGEIWGRSLADDLMELDAADANADLRVHGLTAKPGVGRATRRDLVTLVNRRPVDNRVLGYAVLDAYHGHLPKGRFPPAFLFLEIDPGAVDVNVHPSKREVRFRDEGGVRRFVLDAVARRLAGEAPAPPSPGDAAPSGDASADSEAPAESPPPPTVPFGGTRAPEAAASPPSPQPAASPRPAPAEATSAPKPAKPSQPAVSAAGWTLIRRFSGPYALFQSARGLVLLHVRHADERVRYERIRAQMAEERVASQTLLIPVPLELEPLAAQALEAQRAMLNRNGFRVEPFGRDFYRVEAAPAWLEADSVERFLRDLTDFARQRGSGPRESELASETLARFAAREAYRGGDASSGAALEDLTEQLLRCENPHRSPRGKPTFQEIPWSEWDRRFEEGA